MPHRTEVREIIPARSGRALRAPNPALSRPDVTSRPVIAHTACDLRDSLWFSTILNAIAERGILEPHRLGSLVFGCIQLLPMAFGGSRWPVKSSCAQESASQHCLELPETYSQSREPWCLRSPTTSYPLASVRVSQRPSVGAACPDVTTVFASNLGDSRRSGLRSCQRWTAPSPTCDRRTSLSSSTSQPALCAGGVEMERARISSKTETQSGIAATTSIPGLGRSADPAAWICRCGGSPRPGRTAASMKKRRGLYTSTRALHTAHSQLREDSVSPTLARRLSWRSPFPHTAAGESSLISLGAVIQ
jgi:hypothetical protein